MINVKRWVGSRAFYRTLLAVMIPILIQNGITNFINLLDNVMVGQVGTEQMSGVSIVNQLIFVFNLCVFGAISGAGIFGAQFYGKGDHDGVRYTFRFKLIVALALYVLATLILLCFGEELIGFYLHEGSETGDLVLTLESAKAYLSILLVGLLPFTVTQIYASTLREIGHTVPPMAAGIAGVLVNLTLNYVLIFGKLGAPAMGVSGAALATVISRFVECAVVILWTHRNADRCIFIKGAYRSLHVPAPLVKRIALTGTPLLLNETLWAMGQALLLQCYSVRGIAVVSAMNITNTLFNTFSVLFIAVGSAIAILIGHRLGAGEREQAREDARKMIAFSTVMGLISGLLAIALAPIFPQIYNTTDEVRALAVSFTVVVASVAPMHGYLHACYFTLRSGGKTLITFLFDSGYVWCVNLALAFVLSRYSTLSPTMVYLICQGADVFKVILGTVLIARGSWANNMTEIKGERI